jgi:hypothetical protein
MNTSFLFGELQRKFNEIGNKKIACEKIAASFNFH